MFFKSSHSVSIYLLPSCNGHAVVYKSGEMLLNFESSLFLAVCRWWRHFPTYWFNLCAAPLIGHRSLSCPIFSPFLLPFICRGSSGSISSSHFLQQVKFYSANLSSSCSLPVSVSLSLQDSSSSVGSGEFTGIKELDDISQEIAQLQR